MYLHPHINPVALALGPVKIHWYGIMYLIGFMCAWGMAIWRKRLYHVGNWSRNNISDLIFYAALGIIVGGRVGYMLFYNFTDFIASPIEIFKIWRGGMSFHGGLLGVIIAMWFFARHKHKSFFAVTDFLVPLVPVGILLGRIGNFINGELWGRVTHVSWGMIFPMVDAQTRHPSQIYESLLEGLLVFIIMWVYCAKPRKTAQASAVFLMTYAICRMIAEIFREPDANIGFLAFDYVTMGQMLSIPMLFAGLFLYAYASRKE
jgi:phosphatidylglycerol---prolipoprotein diacylglyceryl transferase